MQHDYDSNLGYKMSEVAAAVRAVSKEKYFKFIGYEPHEKQWLFHRSKARFKIPVCGRRFGKTYMGAREAEPILMVPNKQVWIVGPTYDLGEKEFRVIWNDMIIRLGLGKEKTVKRAYNKRAGDMYIEFPWNTRLEVRSADRSETLVGDALDYVIMAEAAKHSKETWDRFIRPALADRRGAATFSTTPEGQNWIHDLWQIGRNPLYEEYESWRFPSWDNTHIYPDGREDREILLLERTMPYEWFQQEIAADFTSFMGKIYCYDDKTEILTIDGYKNVLDVQVGELVATLSPLGAMEFKPCTKAFKLLHKGKMLKHEGRVVDFCVTPNHRMWTRNRDSRRETEYGFVEAQHLVNETIHNKAKNTWDGNEKERIEFAGINEHHRTKFFDFDMLDWAEFLGWYIAEGSIENDYVFMIGQLPGAKRTMIKELLDRMGIVYHEHQNGLRCTGKQIITYLKQLGKSSDRFIPRDMLNMSDKYLEAMFRSMMIGDGHTTKDGQSVYCTVSRQLADDFQELCLRIGLATNVSYITSGEHPYYRLNIFKENHNESRVLNKNIEEIDYDGYVGCVTVEPYHTVYVRRNGKGMWCGNSEWDEILHVKPIKFNPAWRNYIAFDWGFVNPMAAVEFQVDPMDRIHIWRIHYKTHTRLEVFLEQMRERPQPPGYHIDLCFGDAADPEAVATVCAKFAPCIADPKSKDNWREGIDLVKSFLLTRTVGDLDEFGTPDDQPWLFVDPSCGDIIREFNNYRAAAPATGKPRNPREDAQKYDDHALDALRYGLMHIFKLGATMSLASVMSGVQMKELPDTGYFTSLKEFA